MSGRGGGRGKRNVAFIKPDEPDFLKAMKAQIGYREGPTVEAKVRWDYTFKKVTLTKLKISQRQRVQNLEDSDDDEREDREDEKPQIVVVKEGDLTAEQAAVAQKGK